MTAGCRTHVCSSLRHRCAEKYYGFVATEWKEFGEGYGAPGEIRTPGLLLRRQPLYPAELRARRLRPLQGIISSQRHETSIIRLVLSSVLRFCPKPSIFLLACCLGKSYTRPFAL